MNMKNTLTMVIVLLFVCINASTNDNCFLRAYFKKINIDGREITFTFNDFGARYKISIAEQEDRISEYGEKITINDNTSIQLVSKGNSLIISSIRKDILGELINLDVKNMDLLVDYAFLAKEEIDLRPIGKDVVRKTFLIFNNNLPKNAKEVLLSLKTKANFTFVCENKEILVIEYNKEGSLNKKEK